MEQIFVQKRDGRLMRFEGEKIFSAIHKAAEATKEFGRPETKKLPTSSFTTLRVQTKRQYYLH